MTDTKFQSYGLNLRDCRATEYTEYDTTDLEDGFLTRVIRTPMKRWQKS